jgi:tRNA threonylcarbamoyl adenosine modification protein (Sua5/YciO/YrdC/YwlC family)
MIVDIHPQNPEPRYIRKAAEILAAGGIVIYPTDTVYGIGCSVENKNAIERIYMLKRARADKPFSFVCSDLKNISEYAHVSNAAFKIIKHLVPGPYTFVLPAGKMKALPKILVSKRKTVGIRVPDSAVVQDLVKALGHPILSTSVAVGDEAMANDPDEIIDRFRNQVEMILNAGVMVSELSTVLDLTGDRAVLLRRGAGDVSGIEVDE